MENDSEIVSFTDVGDRINGDNYYFNPPESVTNIILAVILPY